MNFNWIKEVAIEELPQQYQEMARIIGLQNTIKLAEYFSKQSIYFKSLECLIRKKKEEYIHNNFTGGNHQQLARETNYSQQSVYRILKKADRRDSS